MDATVARRRPVQGVRARSGRIGGHLLAHPVLTVFGVALVLRGLVATILWWRYDGVLFGDDQGYILIAKQAAAGQTESWDAYTTALYDVNGTFLRPLAWVFTVTDNVLAGQMLAAVAGAATAALATWSARQVLSTQVALAAGLALAVLPSQVLFSALTLKDSFVWLVLAAVSAALLGAARERRRLGLVLRVAGVGILLFLLGHLREHTLVVAAWAVILSALFLARHQRFLRGTGLIAVAVLIPMVLGLGPAGVGLVSARAGTLEYQRAAGASGASTALVAPPVPAPAPAPPSEPDDAAAVAAQREATARAIRVLEEQAAGRATALKARVQASASEPDAAVARDQLAKAEAELLALREIRQQAEAAEARAAAYAQEAPPEAAPVPSAPPVEPAVPAEGSGGAAEVESNLRYLPRGLAAMVLQPYPWAPANARVRMAQAETILWYPLLALAAVGLLAVRRFPGVLLYPVLVGGGTAVMWALAEGNFGTAYRHRGEFVWVVILLAAFGMARLVRPPAPHDNARSDNKAAYADSSPGRRESVLSAPAPSVESQGPVKL